MITATLSTAAGAARARVTPSSKRERAIRNSLAGRPCFLCGHAVDWSRETGQHGHAGVGWIGHVIAPELWATGGGYVPGNIGACCRTCQYDANHCPSPSDLTAYVLPGAVPAAFLPTKISEAGPDIRDCAPMIAPTTKDARRASRRARIGW